ncbi:hypothetical protein LNKW23_25660 [Paralimibaculum aggregatum]|uniref:YjiS-like domain-containing protein n=1 Tax=Paralimibaculum aggregatum TaxID=3036245 RepID=A0ABQ6LPR0_9RHOB|nr:DUF1127 domain-containing protein [Limibaculum sp. NKW23]GMG83353.1 hypothetical protein LNKW23_25660 [Limibaculum sp. NKW23]
MTDNVANRLPFGAITAHTVVRFGSDLLERIAEWRRVRATASELRRLSPEQLKDIGLTSDEVDNFARRGRW